MDPKAEAALSSLTSIGLRGIIVATTAPELPWAVLSIPVLRDLSAYTLSAQKDGPLMAAVDLFRRSVKALPDGIDLEVVVARKPFAILRAIQVLLADLGLAAGAEKKSP